MNSEYRYETHDSSTEGLFYAVVNGTHYEGRHTCDISTESEHSSEYGYMGSESNIVEGSETIYVFDAEKDEEVVLSEVEHPGIYQWVRDNVELTDGGSWERFPKGYEEDHPALGAVSTVEIMGPNGEDGAVPITITEVDSGWVTATDGSDKEYGMALHEF